MNVVKVQEEFQNIYARMNHFDKHVLGKIKNSFRKFPRGTYTNDEAGLDAYEKDADDLAKKLRFAHPALSYKDDPSIRYVGYIGDEGAYYLYERNVYSDGWGRMVVYEPNIHSGRVTTGNMIKTFHLINDEQWEAKIESGGKYYVGRFKSELPLNQEGGTGPYETEEEKARNLRAKIKSEKDAKTARYLKKKQRNEKRKGK